MNAFKRLTIGLSWLLVCCLLSSAMASNSDKLATSNIEVAKNNLRARGISSSDCGLYTITAAAHILGKEISLEDTFGNMGVQLRPEGMSFEQVAELLKKNGLAAVPVEGLSSNDFAFASRPIIIPLDMKSGASSNHWVTVCGMHDGKVALYDSVDLVSFRSKSEIDLLWNGSGILVGNSAADASQASLQLQLGAVGRKVLFISLGCCLALVVSRFASKSLGRWFSMLSLATSVLAIVIGCSMWQDRVSSVLALQSCLQLSTGHDSQSNVFVRNIESSSDTLIIDCRLEAAYNLGHIPGARNLPINASLNSWLNFAKEAKADKQVVVYCQSAECGWAEVCHQRLKCLGIRSAIFSGGYSRYVSGGE